MYMHICTLARSVFRSLQVKLTMLRQQQTRGDGSRFLVPKKGAAGAEEEALGRPAGLMQCNLDGYSDTGYHMRLQALTQVAATKKKRLFQD